MDAVLTTFGIDWHLLLVQAVNFGLLLAGLTYFLYTPLMKKIEERRSIATKGVDDAALASQELQNIERSRATMLAQAGKEADTVLANARSGAGEKEREILGRAETAAAAVLAEAEIQAKETKARAVLESKEDVAKLIVLGMEKSLRATQPQK